MIAPRFPYYTQYVLHGQEGPWIEAGWVVSKLPLPGHHGEHALCMEWWRQCECVIPGKGGEQWTSVPQDNGSMNKRGQV